MMEQQVFQAMIMELMHGLRDGMNNMRDEMLHMREDMRGMREELTSGMRDVRGELHTGLHGVHEELRSDRKKLDEVYQARHSVKIKFGWQWGLVSLFIAIVASGIT